MKQTTLLSLGTMYIDINCTNFPFDKALFVNRETTGKEYLLDLGGSALNFARLTTKLGLKTTFIGKVGDDSMGKHLLHLLKESKINPSVIVDAQTQTNLAVHYIHADGSSIMTSCGNANQSLTYENITMMLNMHAKKIDYLYLGGCFKLKQLLPSLPELAKQAKQNGMQVILDHGRVNNSVTQDDISAIHTLLPYVDIYLPSIDEFSAVWKVQTPEDGYERVNKVSKARIVVKQGDLGAIGFANENKIIVPAYSVEVVNTVGAGDSFNAGFINAYSQGHTFEESIKLGCATAAIKISQKEFSLEVVKKIFV